MPCSPTCSVVQATGVDEATPWLGVSPISPKATGPIGYAARQNGRFALFGGGARPSGAGGGDPGESHGAHYSAPVSRLHLTYRIMEYGSCEDFHMRIDPCDEYC